MKILPQPHGGVIHQAEKGETANPNGRPKKSFRIINDQLKKKGFEPLQRRELIELYSLLFNLDESEIKELAQDKSNPLSIRLVIAELTDVQTRAKALQDYRNYAFGAAMQNVALQTEEGGLTININRKPIADH